MILIFFPAFAQEANKLLRQGNRSYKQDNFDEAELKYRKALETEKGSAKGFFNLGDALYKQQKFEEAGEKFEAAIANEKDKGKLAKAYHNLGNALLQQKKYKESIDAYKKALLNNPKDEETRYNLAYAQAKLQEQMNQQNQQQKNFEPSEFAKKLKAEADKLVSLRQYLQAFKLMQDGLQKDFTVSYYQSYINRIKDVAEIN